MSSTFNIVIADKNIDELSPLIATIQDNFDCTIQTVSNSIDLNGAISTTKTSIALVSSNLEVDGYHNIIEMIKQSSPKTHIIPAIDSENNDQLKSIIEHKMSDFISHEWDHTEVRLVIKKSITLQRLNKPRKTSSTSTKNNFHNIIGSSGKMSRLFTLISKIAEDEVTTVLIRGESGTGKELVAKAIHNHSNRKKKKFVPVNCAAIPDDLLESELFGHTKGAFTGASQSKQGRIQYADGGTLFLDEIGDMKSSLQAKLLRVLQEKEFEPVGALKPVPVDTRIVAATHCDLEQLVRDGKFREDLYYRLSVIPLEIPPLRERKEDLLLLLKEFIHRYTSQRGREPYSFTDAALNCLLSHDWKGNVRELENLAQHMSILYPGELIDTTDLPEKYQNRDIIHHVQEIDPGMLPDERFALHHPPELSEPDENLWENGSIDFKEIINDFETRLIVQAMQKTGGNKKEAARLLNLKRTTLLEKIKKKNLGPEWEN